MLHLQACASVDQTFWCILGSGSPSWQAQNESFEASYTMTLYPFSYLTAITDVVLKRKPSVVAFAAQIGLHHLKPEFLGVPLVLLGPINGIDTTVVYAFAPQFDQRLR